jgi:uncharacterized protein
MSPSENILNTLKEIKPELIQRFSVSTLGLFGSAARDDFSPSSSDVDLIVEFSKPIGIEFVDLADYIESCLKRKVDLVSKNGIKNKYFKAIESDIVYV